MIGSVLLFSFAGGYETQILTRPEVLIPVVAVNAGVFGAIFLLLSWIYGETPSL